MLWVDPDGATFVACTGTQAFLTRSGGSREAVTPEPRIINPTVVVEWTYLSCLFVEQIIQPLVDGDLEVSIHLRGSSSRPWTLRMVKGKAAEWFVDGSPAGLDDFAYSMKATGNPASDAHDLLVHLYGVFGLTADAIPYSSEGAVDTDAIRALNAQG